MNNEQLIKLIKTNVITAILVAIAVVLGIYVFLFSPDINALELQQRDLDTEWTVIKYNVGNSKDLAEDIITAEKFIEKIDASLLDPSRNTANLRYFYELAEKNKVVLSGPRFSPVEKSQLTEFGETKLDLDITGDLPQVIKWYKDAQSGKFPFNVESFKLRSVIEKASEDKPEQRYFTLDLQVTLLSDKLIP